MKFAILMGVVALAAAGPSAAENWQPFSRSQNNAFMAEVDGIATDGEVTSIKVATVPRVGDATDYSYSVETYQFQCAAETWRTAGVVEHGPDAAESGQYPEEGSAWEEVRANTVPAYLKEMACAGARAVPPHFATVQAFIDAGRP